jgi:hypothetical protein
MKRTLATLALIAAAGVAHAPVAHAQVQSPSTPGSRATEPMPGGSTQTTPGGTGAPTTNVQRTNTAETAAKAQLEAKGYTDIKNLSRDKRGNWSAKATRNNTEVAVVLDAKGNIRER